MTDSSQESSVEQEIDLKDPLLAAFLALLVPGWGHFYQGRTAKGCLFLICILGTFIYGWNLGGCKVVYASWRPADKRWQYFCQMWVGVAAWPAAVQTGFNQPLGDFMRQPEISPFVRGTNELDEWNNTYHGNFELGTVFTMIAGLLNILAIFDAAGGPVGSTTEPEEHDKKKKRRDRSPPDEDPQQEPLAEAT